MITLIHQIRLIHRRWDGELYEHPYDGRCFESLDDAREAFAQMYASIYKDCKGEEPENVAADIAGDTFTFTNGSSSIDHYLISGQIESIDVEPHLSEERYTVEITYADCEGLHYGTEGTTDDADEVISTLCEALKDADSVISATVKIGENTILEM